MWLRRKFAAGSLFPRIHFCPTRSTLLSLFGSWQEGCSHRFPFVCLASSEQGKCCPPSHRSFPVRPCTSCDRPTNKCRNDEGELETLALQLGEGFPLLVEGEMDENCWSVAKALGRSTVVFQGAVERVAKTHFIGCAYAVVRRMPMLCPGYPTVNSYFLVYLLLRLSFHSTSCVALAPCHHGHCSLPALIYNGHTQLATSDRPKQPALVLLQGVCFK